MSYRVIRYRQFTRKTDRKRPDNEEMHEQIKLIDYLRLQYPRVLFTIAPSGMKLPISVAVKMKRMGYRAGTPDVLILTPSKYFGGLFIEMKRCKGGVVSEEQQEFIDHLRANGYCAEICHGFDEAKLVVDNYFKEPVDSPLLKSNNT